MHTPSILRGTVASTLLLSLVIGQSTDSSPLASAAASSTVDPDGERATGILRGGVGVGRGSGIRHEAGTIVGFGSNYKARFDREGFEYTPALGSSAPRNQSLRLKLDAVVRDGSVLLESAATVDDAREHGGTVRYEHGAGIVERYDVRADGVKQSFVFASRPAGNGDLVVRMHVQTPLMARDGEDLETLVYRSAGYGGVALGGVVGIDALGRRAAGTMNLAGEVLELVLPAAFVDAANYPLVLDPLFTTFFSTTPGSSLVEFDPDAAFDETNDTYLLVWERVYSATDTDVMYRRMSRTGVLGPLSAVSTALTQEINPSVGNLNARDTFVIAWQQAVGSFWDISALSVLADGSGAGATLTFGGGGNQGGPSVGGDSTIGSDDVLVAYHDDNSSDVKVQLLDHILSTNAMQAVGQLSLGGGQFRNVSICKDGGPARRYLIAYQRNIPAAGVEFNVIDQQLNRLSITGIVGDARHPAVAGNGVDFILVHESPEVGNPNLMDIRGADIIAPASPASPPSTRSGTNRPINVDVNDQQRLPSVTMLGDEFVVAWNDDSGLPGYDFAAISVEPVTAQTTSSLQFFNVPGSIDNSSAIVAEQTACPVRAIGLFARDENGTTNVHGAFWRTAAAGTLTNYGTACAGSAGLPVHTASGDPNLDGTVTYQISNTPPITIAALFFGVTHQNVPLAAVGAPGCFSLLNLLSWNTVPVAGGSASSSLSIPCDTALVGFQVFAQWGFLDASVNALGLAFSDGIELEIGTF